MAFLGDSVFDLLVREYLVNRSDKPVGFLNKEKINLVCCTSQAKSAIKLLSILNEEEMAVYKRGRNAKVSNIPKNAKQSDYHAATGLESLFGFLYITNRKERLIELFEEIIKENDII